MRELLLENPQSDELGNVADKLYTHYHARISNTMQDVRDAIDGEYSLVIVNGYVLFDMGLSKERVRDVVRQIHKSTLTIIAEGCPLGYMDLGNDEYDWSFVTPYRDVDILALVRKAKHERSDANLQARSERLLQERVKSMNEASRGN